MNWAGAVVDVLILWMLTAPHEFAHAWVATKLGDDTPGREGRVTLNPLAHIDWIGTTLLPLISSLLTGGFIGWGKPVNTDPRKLRFGLNGLLLVALAGPAMNIVLALVVAIIATVLSTVSPTTAQLGVRAARLSVYLALFNLLPVPPLDGSKVLIALRVPIVIYRELARFGFVLLIVLFGATEFGGRVSALADRFTLSIFHLAGLFK